MSHNRRLRQQLIVDGYLRNIPLNIPTSLFDLCFSFYFIKEQFDEKYVGNISIDNESLTCSGINGDGYTTKGSVFGIIECENNQYHHWKLKISEIMSRTSLSSNQLMVGIIESKESIKNRLVNDYFTCSSKGYGIWCSTDKCNKIRDVSLDQQYGESFAGLNDTVDIYFDSKTNEKENVLSFKINNKNYGAAYKFIKKADMKYCLAITIWHQYNVQIVQYSNDSIV